MILGKDTPTVGISERRQVAHSLIFGVDRLATTRRVLAPIRNEAPAQWVEGHLPGLMIPPDDQQFLAGRDIPPGRIVMNAAIAHVHAIHDSIPKWPAALDNSPAHEGAYVVIRQSGANQTARVVRVDEGRARIVMTPRRHETFLPVMLGHIRGHGCRNLLVYCESVWCNHSAVMNADWLPDEPPVRSLCSRMVCTACGLIGADVRPDWSPHPNRRPL